jgi:gliding motility-associated protein GldC
MRKSKIELEVSLDNQNVPELIEWKATDSPTGKNENTKAIALAIWDDANQNTMKIDLWTKDMPVDEMKLFCIQAIGGLSETILRATGDQNMHDELKNTCENLMIRLHKELKG